jgi:hypothetical protein
VTSAGQAAASGAACIHGPRCCRWSRLKGVATEGAPCDQYSRTAVSKYQVRRISTTSYSLASAGEKAG